MSYLAFQSLCFRFDDGHRGHPHATERAKRRGLPGPEITPVELGAKREAHGISVCVEADGLEFLIEPRASEWPWKPVLRIARGGWGRVTRNAKRWGSEHKWLEEYVVNAGLFDAPPPDDVFLGEPSGAHDARRDLLRNGYQPR